MIIRGFSFQTTYDCKKCRSVCCTTEYDLPLCGPEGALLSEKFPKYKIFFQTTSRGNTILRGDACPFFSNFGRCILHETPLKPISCNNYPLIFWKLNQNDILVWINPCRGNGFQWYSFGKGIIDDSSLNNLLEVSDNYYDNYFGEEIDRNNPYAKISEKRVFEQWKFLQKVKEENLLKTLINVIDNPPYITLYTFLKLNSNIELFNYPIVKALNAVLKWLMWSPVGLSLTLKNLQVITTVAALWLLNTTLENVKGDQGLLNSSHYIQQVSSFFATAILPSYWFNIYQHTGSQDLRSFAKQIQLILAGNIPQQKLISFNQF